MSKLPRVVITGAAGAIGSSIRPHLEQRWDLVATDRVAGDGIAALDVTDIDACRHAFDGADAVVHLAAVPDPTASWEELEPANVLGAYCVASAAAGQVPRLVLSSSLQAVSGYPSDRQVRSTDAPLPANLYGATKAWAEALGGWVAMTSTTAAIALRIGFFAATPPSGAEATARNLAAWLSVRDCAELVRAAVEGPVDEPFTVVNGVSANRYRKAEWGLVEQRLGFQPKDDAWDDQPRG